MKKFYKYPSLENTYRRQAVDDATQCGPTGLWQVQEKIHGANFAIYVYPDNTVRFASRNRFLNTPEERRGFYNMEKYAEDWSSKAVRYVQAVGGSDRPPYILFGELCGGGLAGEKDKEVKRVQKGVEYSPTLEFIVFDVCRVVDELLVFVEDRSDAFPSAPGMFVGSLQDCLEYSNEFNSKVPGMLGYDNPEGNTCEGVTIKPCGLHYGRYMLKNKNDTFAEKRRKDPPNPHVVGMCTDALKYVTEHRLDAVLSKEGATREDAKRNVGKYIGLFTEDAVEDFEKDRGNKLTKDERRAIKKRLSRECYQIIERG